MFTYRSYQDGDEVKILQLFEETYKKPLSIEYWNWRFKNNPFDKVRASLAFDGDKMIGHYAVSPVIANVQGKEVLLAHSMTTMTHPDYQGKGLFTVLAKNLFNELKNDKYFGVWGFPNNNSYYGFMKNLDWKPIGEIPFLVSQLKAKGPVNDINISFGFDNIKLISHSNKNSLSKSDKYIQWRYLNHPYNKYHCIKFESTDCKENGFLIFKDFNKSIDLLELYSANSVFTDKMLNWFRYEYLNTNGKESITAWCNIHDENYLVFLKNGFSPKGSNTYMGGVAFDKNTEASSNLWYDLRTWELSMGDSDVF